MCIRDRCRIVHCYVFHKVLLLLRLFFRGYKLFAIPYTFLHIAIKIFLFVFSNTFIIQHYGINFNLLQENIHHLRILLYSGPQKKSSASGYAFRFGQLAVLIIAAFLLWFMHKIPVAFNGFYSIIIPIVRKYPIVPIGYTPGLP